MGSAPSCSRSSRGHTTIATEFLEEDLAVFRRNADLVLEDQVKLRLGSCSPMYRPPRHGRSYRSYSAAPRVESPKAGSASVEAVPTWWNMGSAPPRVGRELFMKEDELWLPRRRNRCVRSYSTAPRVESPKAGSASVEAVPTWWNMGSAPPRDGREFMEEDELWLPRRRNRCVRSYNAAPRAESPKAGSSFPSVPHEQSTAIGRFLESGGNSREEMVFNPDSGKLEIVSKKKANRPGREVVTSMNKAGGGFFVNKLHHM